MLTNFFFCMKAISLLVVLRLAEHILALPVTDLHLYCNTAIYFACNMQYANLPCCNSSNHDNHAVKETLYEHMYTVIGDESLTVID